MRTRVGILQKNDMSSYGIDNVESVPWFAVDVIDGTIYKVGVFNDHCMEWGSKLLLLGCQNAYNKA